MTNAGTIADFHAADYSSSFKLKQKITGVAGVDGTKNVEILVPLKYLSKFWRGLQIPLMNCEIELILTWSQKYVLSNDTKTTRVAIRDANIFCSICNFIKSR